MDGHWLTDVNSTLKELVNGWWFPHSRGRQKYLLLAMDMAKVDGPLSVVKVLTQV